MKKNAKDDCLTDRDIYFTKNNLFPFSLILFDLQHWKNNFGNAKRQKECNKKVLNLDNIQLKVPNSSMKNKSNT